MLNVLYQALKALDPISFQRLIVHLLKAQYPGVAIEYIEGSAGDDGLDVVSGQLDEHPTIWQCKSFPSGIKDSQKQKIRESLSQALKHFTPKRWILCLSIDMDPPVLRWFQRLAKSHSADVQIESWSATGIVHQLLYQDTIREQFFPSTILNTIMIREGLLGTNAFTIDELASLNDQNVGSYLARLQAHDTRLRFEITFNRDREPSKVIAPGALLSMTTGSTVVQVFPNDQEELKRRPLEVHFSVRDKGVEKFWEIIRTGLPQTFVAEELVSVTSDFEFLWPRDRTGMSLEVGPVASQETIPFRVTFGKGKRAVIYECILFRPMRGGTEEVLLESVTTLPFRISLIVRTNNTGHVSFSKRFSGHSVKDVQKQARAILIALKTGGIQFYNLAVGKAFPRFMLDGDLPKSVLNYIDFINELAALATAYGVDLTLPETVTNEDCDALALLSGLLTGITLAPKEIPLELIKCPEADPRTAAEFEECAIRFSVPEFPDEVTLFGNRIMTGPVQYDFSKARIREAEEIHRFLREAPVGEKMIVTIEPINPGAVKRHARPGEEQ
jgi:hypothetical protein